MILTLLIFLLLLSVLVLIHEAGHYFVAKWFGIKVEEFGYGFPPRAWGKKIGETVYSINWLPIGGFVKLYGEDEAGAGRVDLKGKASETKTKGDEKRAFYARPVWQRALVVVAGVVMNFILAALIYYTFLGISGFKTEVPLLGEHTFFGANQYVKSDIIISDVQANSPAGKAGIEKYSKIVSLNQKKLTDVETFLADIKKSQGKEIALETQNVQTGAKKIVKLTPRVNPPKDQGSLGVSFFPLRSVILSYDTPVQKVFSGFVHPVNLMAYNLDVMADLVRVSFEKKDAAPLSEGVSGPVGIYSLVGTIIEIPDMKEKVLQILNLAGILSISLAFFNVLPIPALDGGRLFFILVEGVTRRKVNQRVEGIIHTIGMAVLLTLILLITFKDVLQLFK